MPRINQNGFHGGCTETTYEFQTVCSQVCYRIRSSPPQPSTGAFYSFIYFGCVLYLHFSNSSDTKLDQSTERDRKRGRERERESGQKGEGERERERLTFKMMVVTRSCTHSKQSSIYYMHFISQGISLFE